MTGRLNSVLAAPRTECARWTSWMLSILMLDYNEGIPLTQTLSSYNLLPTTPSTNAKLRGYEKALKDQWMLVMTIRHHKNRGMDGRDGCIEDACRTARKSACLPKKTRESCVGAVDGLLTEWGRRELGIHEIGLDHALDLLDKYIKLMETPEVSLTKYEQIDDRDLERPPKLVCSRQVKGLCLQLNEPLAWSSEVNDILYDIDLLIWQLYAGLWWLATPRQFTNLLPALNICRTKHWNKRRGCVKNFARVFEEIRRKNDIPVTILGLEHLVHSRLLCLYANKRPLEAEEFKTILPVLKILADEDRCGRILPLCEPLWRYSRQRDPEIEHALCELIEGYIKPERRIKLDRPTLDDHFRLEKQWAAYYERLEEQVMRLKNYDAVDDDTDDPHESSAVKAEALRLSSSGDDVDDADKQDPDF